jgi:PAS domain S-box-containing protein
MDDSQPAAELQTRLRDLAALVALPNMWSRAEPRRVIENLLDVLESMLQVDLAYAHAPAAAPGQFIEAGCVAGVRLTAQETATARTSLQAWIDQGQPAALWQLPRPEVKGALRLLHAGLSGEGGSGWVVIGAQREHFPTDSESFLFRVAANQAAIALQTATYQAQLRENQDRLRAIFDQTLVGVAQTDLTGRFVMVNECFCQITGRPQAELMNLRMQDITHPEDLPANQAHFGTLVEVGTGFEIEKRYVRPDGSRVWVRNSVSRVTGSDGQPQYTVAIVQDITERKQAEEAQRRSQQELEDFFENATVGLHWVGPDGTILRANRAELELLGYSRDEYIGHHIAEFHADRGVIEDILQCLARQETLHDHEARLRCKDGSIKHVVISSNVLWEDGRFIHTRCFTRDITERKLAEEALRESERRYRQIFDSAAVSIWTEDFSRAKALLDVVRAAGVNDLRTYLDQHPDFFRHILKLVRVMDVNSQTLRLFEAERPEELLGSPEAIFVPETLPVFRDELVALFEGHRTFMGEAQLRTVRGARRDVVFSVAFPEPDGSFDNVLVSLIDVTDQQRAEAEARRLRLDLYSLLMQAPVPIAVLAGHELVFELANPSYVHVTGGRDIVGKPMLDALPELRGQGFDAFLRQVMANSEPAVGEEALLKLERDGSAQDTYWTFIYAPLRNADGIADRVMAICHEVTVQVLARRQMEALNAKLEARVAERTAALQASNHALEQSQDELRRLSVYLQRVREEERTRIAREIHDELGQQLTGLKMDVAKLQRMANGLDPSAVQRLEDYSQALDLAVQTVRRIASELRPSILDHFGLLAALEWQLDEFKRRSAIATRWTSQAAEVVVPPDHATSVFRVFQESLTNIARHAQATEVDVQVETSSDQLVVQVSDNGRGITPQEILGAQSLGLAGMRERIGLLGGFLDIQGAPGQGTRVLVRVPLGASAAPGSIQKRPA